LIHNGLFLTVLLKMSILRTLGFYGRIEVAEIWLVAFEGIKDE